MSATDQALKTSGGMPIPQWYDPTEAAYTEATGTPAGGYVQARATTLADHSVTGTGAAVVAAAANPARRYLLLQCPDTNGGDVWVSLLGTAAAASPSLQLKAGGGFEWAGPCPGGALSALVASGDELTVWEG
jgi:hypothetical protein